MTFLERLRAQITDRLNARAAQQAELDTILDAIEAEERSDLTDAEAAAFAEARDAITAIDAELAELRAREAELVALAEARAAADAIQPPTPAGSPARVSVGNEERTYRREGRHSFLGDLYAMQIQNDPDAAERIARHRRELVVDGVERRDVTTSAYNGVIPPQYLVDEYAPLARAGRPFLNALISRPLAADGMSFTVPRLTTGATADADAEGDAWEETNQAVTDLTFRAELITSQQDVSRAVFMRGGSIVDDVIFPDMIGAYHAKLDAIALNGSGTTPQHRGVLNVASINSVTYTDASPTVAEFWPKVPDAIQQVNTNRLLPANLVVMHPRRWGWLTSAVDSEGRPLFPNALNVPENALGVGDAAAYGQVVGNLHGLPVVTDANIPTNLGGSTNEDRIIVLRTFDVLLYEDGLMQFTFEQTGGPEEVRLAVGGFSGFTAGRYPTGISVISGTGLATPTF